MSGSRAPHLNRRNGIYHLRMRVPDRLRERIRRQEVCKSLQTYSYPLARRLAASVSTKVQETFEMIDQNTNITLDQARKLIESCFDDIRREVDLQGPYDPWTNEPDRELEEQACLAEEAIGRLAQEIESNAFS